MQVVAISGPRQCALVERPDPKIAEDFVIVKIHSAPMCTEYKAYKDGQPTDRIGHEAAGEVVAVAQPGRVKVGDRVAVMPQYPCGKCSLCYAGDYIHCENTINPLALCDSETGTATYAQYCIKQDGLLLPIPDGVSYDHGAMACCGLGPSFGAMQYMQVDGFDTVLVVGLGPVGLGGVINGVYRGARVIGVDPNPHRARLALELGAAAVVNPEDPDCREADQGADRRPRRGQGDGLYRRACRAEARHRGHAPSRARHVRRLGRPHRDGQHGARRPDAAGGVALESA